MKNEKWKKNEVKLFDWLNDKDIILIDNIIIRVDFDKKNLKGWN